METALTTLKNIGALQTINQFADTLTNQIKSGLIEPIEAFAYMKTLSEAFEKVQKDCKDLVISKIYDLGNDNKYHGFKFEVVEMAIKYDYKDCGSSELRKCNLSELIIKERKKQIESILKSIPSGKMMVDEETGEILHAPVKTSTPTAKMTKLK
jgi:hypothetical protein